MSPPDALLDRSIRFWEQGCEDDPADATCLDSYFDITGSVNTPRETRTRSYYLPARRRDQHSLVFEAPSGHPDRRAKERGMSLIEVLIALTLLAFALFGLIPLFIGAVKTAASANQLTSANTLVREKLEELNGYPRYDSRIAVPVGQNSATFPNDLPSWYNPSTGATSFAATSPGPGWYIYPYTRTYSVEEFAEDLTTLVTEPPVPPTPTPQPAPAYFVKLLTVTVRPTRGPFPGLRQTTQSLYLRFPNG